MKLQLENQPAFVSGDTAGRFCMWRESCFSSMSARPPGRPANCLAICVSSMPVKVSPPGPADSVLIVASRMLFKTICVNIVSNCTAAWRVAALGLRAASLRSESSERLSMPRDDAEESRVIR